MKRKIRRIVVWLLVFALAGCQRKPAVSVEPGMDTEETGETEETETVIPDGTEESKTSGEEQIQWDDIDIPRMTEEEYPVVDGSTATLPLSIKMYQLSTGVTESEAEISVTHTKTDSAYERLADGNADLVVAYESSEDMRRRIESKGVRLEVKPIGRDALVFMANEGNPVASLTSGQVVSIYSGKLKKWSMLGWEDKEIAAFQRPDGSGSQTLMKKLVMKDTPMEAAPSHMVAGEMGELIEYVSSYNNEKNALGYSVYFYARNMYAQPGLRFMAIDGVTPSNETIKSRQYPFVNEFYAAVRADEPQDSKARQLFEWLTADGGQSLVQRLGYVGVGGTGDVAQTDEERVPDASAADIRLEDGQYLAVDGHLYSGRPGTALLGKSMELVNFLPGMAQGSARRVSLMTDGESLIMSDAESGMEGVYTIGAGWTIQPDYYWVGENEDGTYEASSEDGSGVVRLDGRGAVIGREEEAVFEVDDKIWREVTAQSGDIYSGGQKIGTIDFTEYGTPLYGNVVTGDREYYLMYYKEPDRFLLFDSLGEIVFREEDIPDEYRVRTDAAKDWITFDGLSKGGVLEVDVFGQVYLYSLKSRQILTKTGDKITSQYSRIDGETIGYRVVGGGERYLLDLNGERIKSGRGVDCTVSLGMDYYGYLEDGNVVVERKTTGELFQLPLPVSAEDIKVVDIDGWALTEGVFELAIGKKYYLYHKEKLLESAVELYEMNSGRCTSVKCMEPGGRIAVYIFSEDGDRIVYQSELDEYVMLAEETWMVTQRGDYLYVMDYDNHVAMKTLVGYMQND